MLISTISKCVSVSRLWIARQTLSHLESIRTYELENIAKLLPSKATILEIGAGTGWQAKALEMKGHSVVAVDLPSSTYSSNRVIDIIEYDGKTLPFNDNSFDIIFSSNVLEHVHSLNDLLKENQRVIKPNGHLIHVLPSSSWRVWTNITNILKFGQLPTAHGEHADNCIVEIYFFSRRWWANLFQNNGFTVVKRYTNGLFYTGNSVMDSRLSINVRKRLSVILGSSCNIFVLKCK